MFTSTDEAVRQITEILEQHGISDYVLAIRDPDSFNDLIQGCGSPFWRTGVGTDLIEQAKEERRIGRAV